MNTLSFGLIVASVSLNALAQICLRNAMLSANLGERVRETGWIALAWFATNPFLLLGMLCYAVSIGLWLAVLSKLEVSLAYPFLSIGYIITAVIGYFFMGEAVTAFRITGIAFICIGLLIMSVQA